MQNADDAVITGNSIRAAHAGIYVETSARALVENNTISSVTAYPDLSLYQSGYGIYVADSADAKVLGNEIDGTASMGISTSWKI